ncbi:hypothetical protein CAOG_04020 [Capsaspora owczarzaki ATCC 30864]|uniref:CTLH domain-containing protein n=1 Tax=Capsaspora owczarzaki (strain ATCC 30864) TaxID=595528 RepID=A0A0D2UDR1_CAPO3|nr:hypothetical protein CAOG_04020 [Capsaspora owczarzaki ATCC 30864]KJE93196.1 hypothetical protein, variant [Capsaspora owczarzaki ATCC 30864]|eukprot:XP_004347845.1 hypothetical protein CAOG_04020 [Capsaspora owczarzaki ATCC 30864]
MNNRAGRAAAALSQAMDVEPLGSSSNATAYGGTGGTEAQLEAHAPSDLQVRMIVLSYLIHHSHADTARALMRTMGLDCDALLESVSTATSAASSASASAPGSAIATAATTVTSHAAPSSAMVADGGAGGVSAATSTTDAESTDPAVLKQRARKKRLEMLNEKLAATVLDPEDEASLAQEAAQLKEFVLSMLPAFSSMNDRKNLSDQIIAGDVENALAGCAVLYPGLFPQDKSKIDRDTLRVLFLMQSQIYLELVRANDAVKAFELLQNQLGEYAFLETHSTSYMEQLQDLAPLLAYSNPSSVPGGQLMNVQRRELVASALNTAILGYLNAPKYDPLSATVRQLTATRDFLSRDKQLSVRPFKFQEFVQDRSKSNASNSSNPSRPDLQAVMRLFGRTHAAQD